MDIKKFFKKNAPEILIGIGLVGMVGAIVSAVKETPKAMQLIEEKKEELEVDKLTAIDTVKTTWKCYIPAATALIAGGACILGASRTSQKRNAALAAAYSASEAFRKTYAQKVLETVGEKKEKEIRSEIAKDAVKLRPPVESEIITTGKGSTLCLDELTSQYFWSDREKIKSTINNLNLKLRDEMYITQNELLYELGERTIKASIGDSVGWSIDDGYIDVTFSSALTEDGRPCLVLQYLVNPRYI